MVRNSRGFLSGNTKKLRRKKRQTISDIIKLFSVGDKVVITIQPERAGAPHLRYQGRIGTITEKRSRGYVVKVKDGNKVKNLIATAFHLRAVASKG